MGGWLTYWQLRWRQRGWRHRWRHRAGRWFAAWIWPCPGSDWPTPCKSNQITIKFHSIIELNQLFKKNTLIHTEAVDTVAHIRKWPEVAGSGRKWPEVGQTNTRGPHVAPTDIPVGKFHRFRHFRFHSSAPSLPQTLTSDLWTFTFQKSPKNLQNPSRIPKNPSKILKNLSQ